MNPSSRRRLVGGAAALMLIGATLLSTAGSALAGETRDISIAMTPLTAATAGGVTETNITITNVSGHTLSNAHFLIGLDQVAPLVSGASVVAVFGASAGPCPVIADPVTTFDCPLGNIGAKPSQQTRSLSVAFQVSSEATLAIAVEVKVSETGSDVGSNTNFQTASASITAGAASCANLVTFVAPGHAKPLTLGSGLTGCSTDQVSGLVVPDKADGTLVQLSDAGTATNCPSGFTCLGDVVSAVVNGGNNLDPYLKWTIFYSNATLGTTKPDRVAFIHDATIIKSIKSGGLCKSSTALDCQEQFSVGTDGVTFVVRTLKNGLIKGMH